MTPQKKYGMTIKYQPRHLCIISLKVCIFIDICRNRSEIKLAIMGFT